MSDHLTMTLVEPNQAKLAITRQLAPFCKQAWERGPVVLTAMPQEDAKTLRQLAFYWGPMLRDISEQAVIGGQKYSKQAWHELGKRQFLPRRTTRTQVAGRKRPVVTTTLGSLKQLSVRRMSKYLDEFQAFAATDLGVHFSVAKWEEYRT